MRELFQSLNKLFLWISKLVLLMKELVFTNKRSVFILKMKPIPQIFDGAFLRQERLRINGIVEWG